VTLYIKIIRFVATHKKYIFQFSLKK